jgi:nucleotide-binding universal stress UspA family protein
LWGANDLIRRELATVSVDFWTNKREEERAMETDTTQQTGAMKVLIAYDGSTCAEAALQDLERAGLPQKVEARILSVSEVVLPPPMSYTLPSSGALDLQRLLEHNALELGQEAARRLSERFPQWTIGVEVHPGSPANAIITLADEWQPDLIVLGSHGRSAVGRLFLGSVSHTVLNEAHGSVRIARGPGYAAGLAGAPAALDKEATPRTGPVRILVGIDGSAIAEVAVDSIAARHWPANSVVRLLHADFNISPVAADHVLVAIAQWISEERGRIAEAVERARQILVNAGLTVEVVVRPGDARQLLLEEAEEWHAETIFLGAKNLTQAGRLRLGSVSSAIASRAHCSVEVVRRPR